MESKVNGQLTKEQQIVKQAQEEEGKASPEYCNVHLFGSDEEHSQYISQVAKIYKPSDADIFLRDPKGSVQALRQIFHASVPLTELEMNHVANFRQYVQECKLQLPPGYDDENGLMLRFLDGNQYKSKETYDNIIKHYTYITTTYPLSPSLAYKYIQACNQGVFYILKRDRSFRPIIIFNVKRLKELGKDMDFICGVGCFILEFLQGKCLIPGQIENWIIIFDFKGVGITEIPKKLMKAFNQPSQDFFKGRLYKSYLINTQWILKLVWKIAKKLIDPLTLSKFVVCGEKTYAQELAEAIDPDNLEKKFGGNLENKTNNFFPPDLL